MHNNEIHNYRIVCLKGEELNKISIKIGTALVDFVFNPEMEYDEVGFPPVQRYDVFGAWRNRDSDTFVFLYGLPLRTDSGPYNQLLLSIAGNSIVVDNVISSVEKVLKNLESVLIQNENEETFENQQKRKRNTFNMISLALAAFSTFMKILSSTMKETPEFEFVTNWMRIAYDYAYSLTQLVSSFVMLITVFFLLITFIYHGISSVRNR